LISLRIVNGLTRTVLASSMVGVLMSASGMIIAFYADIAPGGSVVLTGISILTIVELFAFASRWRNRHRVGLESFGDHKHGHESHAHGATGDGIHADHTHR
ncbi:MAG: hypothetical protein ACPHK0_06905, partial [Dehalococcoidia bacterium]